MVDRSSLQKRLKEVIKAGGEGLMLHRADAPYGRSETLLKVKPWDDAEAVVVAHLPGKGKYAGMLGALRVHAADEQILAGHRLYRTAAARPHADWRDGDVSRDLTPTVSHASPALCG